MYPGTIFTIDDQSDIEALTISDTIEPPVQMIGFSSDKGTEDFIYIRGNAFFKQFGEKISFAKHGQPLLQAANAINNGGRLFCKRIVAPDSTLSNVGIVAYVNSESKQKTKTVYDEGTNTNREVPLYTDKTTGQETEVAEGNDPVMVTFAKVSFNTISVDATKSNDLSVIAAKFKALATDGFPLFLFTDMGRGVSDKRVMITPDYNMSRTSEYTKFILSIYENNDELDEMVGSINPDIIELNENVGFETVTKGRTNPQIRCKTFEESFVAFMDKIKEVLTSEAVGLTEDEVDAMELRYQDLLFGKTIRGIDISDKLIYEEDNPLKSIYGLSLENGSNGSFGDAPIKAKEYANEMVKVFNGTFNDDIYNVDNNPIDVIIDANYPNKVKRAIEELVAFREDISYLRDIANEDESGVRTPCRTITEFKYADLLNSHDRYCETYSQWYDIIDPYTKKQITVTMGYSLARIITKHFVNGRNRPLCGIKFEATIPEAIEGTLNFVPKITPAGNQKTDMEDLKINYASYLNGTLTIETCYTSQEKYTQLSYANNVYAIQEIIHQIRKQIPRDRYTFLDGDDFDSYQKEVNAILSKYSGNFKSLSMEYLGNSAYENNKIYYATIKVQFRNFVQTELFKILAIRS